MRGKLVTRGKAKQADYILYHQHFPIALIEAKGNNFAIPLIGESWPLSNVLALMSMQSRLIAAWGGCIGVTQRTMTCMYWSMGRK